LIDTKSVERERERIMQRKNMEKDQNMTATEEEMLLLKELERIKEEYERIEKDARRKVDDVAVKPKSRNMKIMSPVKVPYEPLRTPLKDVTSKSAALSSTIQNRRRLLEPLLPVKQPSFDDDIDIVKSPCMSEVSSVSALIGKDEDTTITTLNDVCSPIEQVSGLTDILETQLRVAEAAVARSTFSGQQRRRCRRKTRKPQHFHVKLVQTDDAISLKRRVSMLQTVQKSRALSSSSSNVRNNITYASKTLRKISAAKVASLRQLRYDDDDADDDDDDDDDDEGAVRNDVKFMKERKEKSKIADIIPSPPKITAPVLGSTRRSKVVIEKKRSRRMKRKVSFNI
jgi:hypothetical protein